MMGGVEVREGRKHSPYLHDPRKPPKAAKGWPHFVRYARTMGCGRWPGRLSFGTGLRRYATRPSHSSSAWHRVVSGVAGTSRGSGEDCSAHPPREIPTTTIMEGTRKRSITGPSHPHSPECVEGKGSRNRSRRDPPRSVPPPTPVPTGGHPCSGARLASQVGRREVLEYWANNSVRGVSHAHFVTPRTVAPGPFSDTCPSPLRPGVGRGFAPGAWGSTDRAEKRGAR